jgi:hypothetical protein
VTGRGGGRRNLLLQPAGRHGKHHSPPMRSPMDQHASAYEWRGRIFLHPDSRTTDGVWLLTEPISSADPHDASELGRAILLALAGSKTGIPHPSIWGNAANPLLKFAGAKSFRAFFGSARSVSIRLQDDGATFTPYRNLGPKDGYRPIKEKGRTSSANHSELGAALLSAFNDTE